jgi:hypothetical protein
MPSGTGLIKRRVEQWGQVESEGGAPATELHTRREPTGEASGVSRLSG